MTIWTLILRNLRFHARAHLGALLGAAVGSAVLIGALAVGDSVRGSLLDMALARLGRIQIALASNDRFFRAQLAEDLEHKGLIEGAVASAILLPAIATTADDSARANRVQLLGIDERFWNLSEQQPSFTSPSNEDVVLSTPLAQQLKARVGDIVVLRVAKPSSFSRDAPITPQEDSSVSLRLTVHGIASDDEFGRFSLQASQVAPFNAFVSLATLQTRLNLPGKANLLLASPDEDPWAAVQANTALRQKWKLADAELELRDLPEVNALELRTDRVFLDPPVAEAAFKADTNAQGILTYFVNELRAGDRKTPYSMVTAMAAPIVPPDMRDDEIIINSWLADDLQAKLGDKLTLSYYVIGLSRRLEERTNQFIVHAVVPLAGAAADRNLMPDFPGLEKAESTRDWNSSLPIKLDLIRPRDEDFWKKYRGTPKAFVTLPAGQKMWSNRFGNLTAIRFQTGTHRERTEKALMGNLSPASLGLSLEPVRQQALAAVAQSQDFGGLFLGFSFFLIVAALLLMALLFQFGIEQRATEAGTLLALGFTPGQVRRLLLMEGGALAVLGATFGLVGGVAFAQAMLHALSTVWRDAVGTSALHFHAEPVTLAMGAVSGVIVTWLTMWLALRKQARQPARELLDEGTGSEFHISSFKFQKGIRSKLAGIISGLAALLSIGWAFWKRDTANAELFFSAGTLLLIAGIAFCSAFLSMLSNTGSTPKITLTGMSVRNATRRRKRSLATLSLLACGSFLIASIGVFRLDVGGAEKRSSGTGGFALIGESTVPIVQDLNSKSGLEFFGIDEKDLAGVSFVPFRVRDGDDASCLNLNRAQKPRLLGVNPKLLAQREAFTFSTSVDGAAKEKAWLLLKNGGENAPAIGDAASIEWALGKKIGDTIPYADEHGRDFRLRIVGAVANSILQGNLLIDEDEFVKRFPSESGYRMFLIDAPSNRLEAVSASLSRALRDYGLELTPTPRRLAAFNAVQNTYLSTFQILGGLGLLLGSVGLGVVVMRNVLERRGELALLLAVGFRARALKWLVVSEHGALLLLGLAVGVISALAAVLPALLSPGTEVPYVSLALTLTAVLVNGLVWTWVAAKLALRGRLLSALRNE